jgi:aminoglycoside N3'-acetyltransferase
VLRDSALVRIDYPENDHCCERFTIVDEWLGAAGLQREGQVGNAQARLARSRDIVRVARGQLAKDPLIFLHPAGSGCEECDRARAPS